MRSSSLTIHRFPAASKQIPSGFSPPSIGSGSTRTVARTPPLRLGATPTSARAHTLTVGKEVGPPLRGPRPVREIVERAVALAGQVEDLAGVEVVEREDPPLPRLPLVPRDQPRALVLLEPPRP